MRDKLVTIAIHTMDKANALKSVLEAEGIEAFLYMLDALNPVALGIRVRIHESDLPHALEVVESMKDKIEVIDQTRRVLVPIDFSPNSLRVCKIGFELARRSGAEVILLHAYYLPEYSFFAFQQESNRYNIQDIEQERKSLIKKESEAFKAFTSHVKECIVAGQMADCKFIPMMDEGVPEDVIIDVASKYNTTLIVMGVRDKNTEDIELVGSVTAEVMERSQVPVLTVPMNMDVAYLDALKNVMFATNLDDRMLISFDRVMKLFEGLSFNLFFTHFEQKEDKWNEIKLAGIKEYFARIYPKVKMEYALIRSKTNDDFLESFRGFVSEKSVDLIVVSMHRRSILTRLFNPSVAKQMLFHYDKPILVVRS